MVSNFGFWKVQACCKMAPGRDIDETDSVRIAALFMTFIVITLLFEKLTHFLDHNLTGRTRRGLRHALHHIEEELLALGLISLVLIVLEVGTDVVNCSLLKAVV